MTKPCPEFHNMDEILEMIEGFNAEATSWTNQVKPIVAITGLGLGANYDLVDLVDLVGEYYAPSVTQLEV